MKLPSRRSFLQSSATAAMLTAAGCASSASSGKGYVDAHVHVWTPDTGGHALTSGMRKAGCAEGFTPGQLFFHCKPQGVSRIVLIQMSFHQHDNSYMLDAIESHPGVFRGVAIVSEHEAGVSTRMRYLARRGVSGFRIHQGGERNPERWLGSPGMAEMWRTAADEGLNICALIDPEALPLIDKMCSQFPDTPVVVDHFARLGMAGVITRADLDRLLHLSAHPKVHLKTSAFYALGKKKPPYLDLGPMIRECRDHFGAERLMWASDAPFQVESGHTYEDSISLIRDRLDFLTPSDREWMLARTARRVFFS